MEGMVQYKFKSAKDFDSVSFSGTVIRLFDLKRAIVEAKALHKGMDFDLSVINDQTKEEYVDDNAMVPKNASVIVKRIPAKGKHGLLSRIKSLTPAVAIPPPTVKPATVSKERASASPTPLQSQQPQSSSPSQASGVPPIGGTSGEPMTAADEASALAALNQKADSHRQGFSNKVWTATGGSTGGRGIASSGGGRGTTFSGGPHAARGAVRTLPYPAGGRGANMPRPSPGLPPPPGYVCKRCNVPGHFVKECPTNGNPNFDTGRLKRTLGIPSTMLKVVEENEAGSFIDSQGRRVVMTSNKHAFSKLKDTKGGSTASRDLIQSLSAAAPAHLKCSLCSQIVQDAILVPCCQGSACDTCMRHELANNSLACPLCQRPGVSPDLLIPNKSLRAAVDDYIATMSKDSKTQAELQRQETEQREALARQEEAEQHAAGVEAKLIAQSEKKLRKGPDAVLNLGQDAVEDSAAVLEDEFGGDIYTVPVVAPAEEMDEKEEEEDHQPGLGEGSSDVAVLAEGAAEPAEPGSEEQEMESAAQRTAWSGLERELVSSTPPEEDILPMSSSSEQGGASAGHGSEGSYHPGAGGRMISPRGMPNFGPGFGPGPRPGPGGRGPPPPWAMPPRGWGPMPPWMIPRGPPSGMPPGPWGPNVPPPWVGGRGRGPGYGPGPGFGPGPGYGPGPRPGPWSGPRGGGRGRGPWRDEGGGRGGGGTWQGGDGRDERESSSRISPRAHLQTDGGDEDSRSRERSPRKSQDRHHAADQSEDYGAEDHPPAVDADEAEVQKKPAIEEDSHRSRRQKSSHDDDAPSTSAREEQLSPRRRATRHDPPKVKGSDERSPSASAVRSPERRGTSSGKRNREPKRSSRRNRSRSPPQSRSRSPLRWQSRRGRDDSRDRHRNGHENRGRGSEGQERGSERDGERSSKGRGRADSDRVRASPSPREDSRHHRRSRDRDRRSSANRGSGSISRESSQKTSKHGSLPAEEKDRKRSSHDPDRARRKSKSRSRSASRRSKVKGSRHGLREADEQAGKTGATVPADPAQVTSQEPSRNNGESSKKGDASHRDDTSRSSIKRRKEDRREAESHSTKEANGEGSTTSGKSDFYTKKRLKSMHAK